MINVKPSRFPLSKYLPTSLPVITFFCLALFLLLGNGCQENNAPIPKPRGWPRIDLPKHEYQQFSSATCPFTFEYPKIGLVEREMADSCRFNLYFEKYSCRWHITYRNVPSSGQTVSQHNEEYRKLVFKHIQKVAQIKEHPLKSAQGNGIFYELYGTVGVPAQVFFTDSTHILLASFYFDTAVRNDSLAPIIDFMKEDLRHMAESIVWKE
ncbi:MAG TPA: hypothetical protein ENJ82_00290 [Bacteroidetes bacterium]|nr:hypothetical protein [Bacteroidota bacterium]